MNEMTNANTELCWKQYFHLRSSSSLYTKLRDFEDGTRNAGGNDSAVPLGLLE